MWLLLPPIELGMQQFGYKNIDGAVGATLQTE